MYTLNTATEETQEIAYSTDGGYTFTKYVGNPVISIGSTQFRDPKVIWYAPTQSWVVVISYAREFTIGFFTSPNLLNWTHVSNFSYAGVLGLQYECPNLVSVPMLANGSLADPLDPSNFASTGEMWILQISINPGAPQGGSISQYFPGTFNGTVFTAVDAATRFTDFGKDNYAGQYFYGIPDDSPPISIAWASNWEYAQVVPTGTFFYPQTPVLSTTPSLTSYPHPRSSRRLPLLHDPRPHQCPRQYNPQSLHPPLLPRPSSPLPPCLPFKPSPLFQ